MAQQLRLVIADDESLIRMNLKETLVGLGYLVVGEAGDGVSVVNLARELRPDARVLVTSGSGAAEAAARFDGRGPAGFLQKPYMLPELREAVRGALGAGSPGE